MRRAIAAAAVLWALAALSAPLQAFGDIATGARALELVTPAEPVPASVYAVQAISADGDDVAYVTVGDMAGAPAGDLEANNRAVRGADGWSSTPLGYPYPVEARIAPLLHPIRPLAFDADLNPLLWTSVEPLVPGGPKEGNVGIYRVQPGGTPLLLADTGKESEGFIGAPADASRVVFFSDAHLLPGDAGRGNNVSIYEADGTEERLVDVDSEGHLLSTCGSEEGGQVADGRIFFTNPPPSGCGQPSHVYMREGDETVDVSASQCTRLDCDGSANSDFVGATPSGSSVFLTSEQQLTNDDHDERRDLYRYDVGSGDLSLVSEEVPGAEGTVSNRRVQVSADGSRVYFVANGGLLPEQEPFGEFLYLADATGLHLVAPTGVGFEELQISGDGRVALFETTAGLEADDTDGRRDVYLWSADAGTLTRLSKGGPEDNGPFDARIVSPMASQILILFPRPGGEYRALTEDGQEAFFSTAERLLPQDRNEVTDVYGWSHGELSLISPGAGSDPAEFAGASRDGRTVLFGTAASLLPADQDGGDRDLYAARIGGGFPTDVAATSGGCGQVSCPPAPRSRLVRQAPPTVRPGGRTKRGRLRLLHVDPGAEIAVSAGRPLRVYVRVPAPGRISGLAKMRVGKRSRLAAQGVTGAAHAGKVTLTMYVTSAARAALQRSHVLRVRLVVREARLRLSRTLVLKSGRGT